jgi:hypothetical protein
LLVSLFFFRFAMEQVVSCLSRLIDYAKMIYKMHASKGKECEVGHTDKEDQATCEEEYPAAFESARGQQQTTIKSACHAAAFLTMAHAGESPRANDSTRHSGKCLRSTSAACSAKPWLS